MGVVVGVVVEREGSVSVGDEVGVVEVVGAWVGVRLCEVSKVVLSMWCVATSSQWHCWLLLSAVSWGGGGRGAGVECLELVGGGSLGGVCGMADRGRISSSKARQGI